VTDKVVDASAIVAVLFNEVTREAVVPRLRDCSPYAPALLGFVVANACLKKIRAAPGERRPLLDAFGLLGEEALCTGPHPAAARPPSPASGRGKK
jgi:predicted nucleic acid-binding protein